jgi:hypothetical protein
MSAKNAMTLVREFECGSLLDDESETENKIVGVSEDSGLKSPMSCAISTLKSG